MALVDYFLKIDGIEGESQDAKHKGEIQLESFSWGETQRGAAEFLGKGRGVGKVSMKDFSFTMKTNKSSPKLFLACACGDHFKKAVLTCRKAGTQQQEFLKITFTDLLVSGFDISGADSASIIPMEQVAINFGMIEWEYKPQNADGSLAAGIRAGYDQRENKIV